MHILSTDQGGMAMDLNWIWKAILIVLGGSMLLRIAGRKSISQLTVAQTVIMISIGSLIIQPVSGANIWLALGVALVIVITLVVVEYLEVKWNWLEKLFTGKAVVIIADGKVNEENLRKLRLTADKLEVRLRQKSIANIEQVQWATLEPNGQLGFQLKPGAQPASKEDIYKLMVLIEQKLAPSNLVPPPQPDTTNIFTEIDNPRPQLKESPEKLK